MAPLWLPRSVPSAWCVPAIEPRPQQTAQTILGSSCTRRQGMLGVVQSGAPRVGTGCSGCHKWIYQRAGRRVGDALAAAEYGCCPVLLPEEAGSDACCLRCMLCASECLEALPCSSHTCHVYPSGGITIQTAHARGHPCCCLGRVDERNSARQRPAPGMEETWPAGAYHVCAKMSLRFLTLVRVCLC